MTPKSETILKGRRLNTIAIAVSAIAIALSGFALVRQPSRTPNGETELQPGLLQRIEQSGEIHAGYGVYPPYTQEDPNTKKVSGFSVDVIEEIAAELKCKVVWHRLNWNTMSADLKRGEFDMIADPIFQTIPRAREFSFTAPYAYFADGIAVVRKDDNRFPSFASLDRAGITIAVGQGWASETLIKSRFSKPKIMSVQTTTDLLQPFNDVIAGRADVAVGDAADAQRFVKEHSHEVKALWLDDPPAAMPAGFALRPDDARGAEFLTVCLGSLESTGVLEGLANKWHVTLGKSKN